MGEGIDSGGDEDQYQQSTMIDIYIGNFIINSLFYVNYF